MAQLGSHHPSLVQLDRAELNQIAAESVAILVTEIVMSAHKDTSNNDLQTHHIFASEICEHLHFDETCFENLHFR